MIFKTRVLHIDDNLYDRQLVKDVLLKENTEFELVEADTRQKFEQFLEEKIFDIILSDFNILGFNGLQVLQIVKEKYSDIPVIIVTGTGSEEVAIEAMKMGAADYVIKSVKHIRGLEHTIRTVLANKKVQDENEIARNALCKSEEKYRKIFENIQDVFYQIDEKGIITEISPSIFRFSGYSREEMIGTKMAALFDDPEKLDILMCRLEKGVEVWDYEARLTKKSGLVKYASLNAHLMFNENNMRIGMEGSFRDITERKQMEIEIFEAKEKAEESDRLKTAFLHNISHEIRTPMNAIIGFSSFLGKPNLSMDKQRYFADIIMKSSNQLLSIITDIIIIATVEAGQEKIRESELNINTICKFVYDQFFEKTQDNKLSFHYKTALSGDEANIITDETKLVQILTNLLSNAIKFTKKGYINFGYGVKGKQLEFFVEDTGIGIPMEMKKEIFKRFRQVAGDVNPQFGGSGLGLSISKAYVELLGGKIWLNSELDSGTKFYFRIPYKRGASTLREQQPIKSLEVENNRKKTLLVAEDEELNFLLLEELLSSINVNIILAVNGLEAVEICKSNQLIDLVLMDIKMPVMDGYEATKRIREFRPALPIIAQTAYITDLDKGKAIASGCNDFISKPFGLELLISKIEKLLSIR